MKFIVRGILAVIGACLFFVAWIGFSLLVASLGGCVKPTPSPIPSPPDATDGAPLPPLPEPSAASRECSAACAVLAYLGCPEAQPTPDGESCDFLCTRVADFPGLTMPTACVAKARTIDEVRRCPTITCGASRK